MKFLKIVIVLATLLLAACGGQTAATTVPSSATNPPQSQTDSSGAGFTLNISGNITATLASPTDKVDFSKNASGTDAYTLTLTRADGLLNTQIVFYGSNPPALGNYAFSLDAVAGSMTAAVYDQSGSTARAFTLGTGALTLKQNDNNTYTGSFEFTSVGGEPGSQNQNITVTGSFAGIALRT